MYKDIVNQSNNYSSSIEVLSAKTIPGSELPALMIGEGDPTQSLETWGGIRLGNTSMVGKI